MGGKWSAVIAIVAVVAVGCVVPPAVAQTAQAAKEPSAQAGRPPVPRRIDPARESRYQIGVMERVLEDAVEHGFSNWRERWQAVMPAQTMLLDNARVRGYRLDDYGMFFDVEVPSLETTWFSMMRTLEQNGLGLTNALKTVKAHIEASGDANLEQALKRIELQVGPIAGLVAAPGIGALQPASSSPQAAPAQASDDTILSDPEEAYRTEVIHALSEAMLDHGGPLQIADNEVLTIAARRNEVRPRIAPVDNNARTIMIRLRGSDLRAFRAGQISREQAIEHVEVRVF